MKHYLLLIFTFIVLSCHNKDNDNEVQPDIITQAENKVVEFTGHDNLRFHGNLYIPDGKGPFATVIILHGCGGLYGNAANHTMEPHFNDWIEMLRSEKIVTLFLDSYHFPRALDSFCSKAPPEDAICSPAYERTKDVNDALSFLSSLNFVDKKRIGLLGFSQGAETAIASAVDMNIVTKDKWTVKSAGSTYNVPSPTSLNSDFTIKAIVAYYPGLGFYSYFGSPNNYMEGKYVPVAPLLINSASEDPLYTNGATETFYKRAIQSGANESTGNNVNLTVYQGAAHSFDGKSSGPDGVANAQAKANTMDWLRKYLLQ